RDAREATAARRRTGREARHQNGYSDGAVHLSGSLHRDPRACVHRHYSGSVADSRGQLEKGTQIRMSKISVKHVGLLVCVMLGFSLTGFAQKYEVHALVGRTLPLKWADLYSLKSSSVVGVKGGVN